MRVLVGISTEQSISNPSMGSERQTSGYANALAERGHVVHLVNILKESPDWSIPYDVCHLINASGLKGPYELTAQLCREKEIPVLISPVYWPTDEVEKELVAKKGVVTADAGVIANKFAMHINGVARMLLEADMLLPNAEAEMRVVEDLIQAKPEYRVIHNGVNVKEEIEPALKLNEYELMFDKGLEDMLHERFVLCVGRVEVRKNQDALISALKPLWEEDPDLQLVLMGERSAPYMKFIQEEIKGKNILLCPPGPPGAVMKIMRRCTTHALVSFIETPGLVNLEAAALNKPIVVADRGSVREYLGEREGVFYCEPTDVYSITKALRGALACGEVESLGKFVRETYCYERIANILENTYKEAIDVYGVDKR